MRNTANASELKKKRLSVHCLAPPLTLHSNLNIRKYDFRQMGKFTADKTAVNYDVLLTVHLSIILVINQLNAQILVL